MKTFLVTSIHNVYVDDYNMGQLERVQVYDMEKSIQAETWKDAVNEYFDSHLYLNLGVENCEIHENTLETSCLVDVDNDQPSESEVFQWQGGNLTLYSNDISISVYEVVKLELC